MDKTYNELFREITAILRRDYAGGPLVGDRYDPRYYNQTVGQAWHDQVLDDLLFLRVINQMLAATGDRHLRFRMLPTEQYTPWGPGFFTRRCGDSLYVTALCGETELSVGDRIVAINGGSPIKQRRLIQKNFFYSDTPEREDWNGLLKMADTVTVLRDGHEMRIPLNHHPLAAPALTPKAEILSGDIVYLRPGAFDGTAAELLPTVTPMLSGARGLILDLRGARGEDEDDALAFLPYLCRRDTLLRELLDIEFVERNTRLNNSLKGAAVQDDPDAADYIRTLAADADRGDVARSFDTDEIIPGQAPCPAAVLTDTYCRDAGEMLVLAARRAGVPLVGRPTLGTADLCSDVSYQPDDRFVLTWPTAVAARALRGERTIFSGLVPEHLVPWTPDELQTDTVLQIAKSVLTQA